MGKIRKFLRVEDQPPRQFVPVKPERLDHARMVTTMTGPKVDDRDFVAKYATDSELAEIRRVAEERLRSRAPFTFLKCNKCGWRTRGAADEFTRRPKLEDRSCAFCNPRREIGRGFMAEMTKAEVAQFFLDETERGKRFRDGLAIKQRAELNLARAKEGKPPLTEEEFLRVRAASEADERARQEQMRELWSSSRKGA